MTSDKERVFHAPADDDAALAAEISATLGIELPPECTAGLAANARIIQQHADTLRSAKP